MSKKIASQLILTCGCLTVGTIAGFLLNDRMPLQAQSSSKTPSRIPKELTSYREIVKEVLPAVVSIEIKSRLKPVSWPKAMVPEEAGVEAVSADVIQEEKILGFGSGVIIDPKGVILTNYHVVNGADQVLIRLPDGRQFTMKEMHVDRKTDLAILRVQTDRPLPFLEFADSDAMEVGDRVLAIGAPFGLTSSVTQGIISAKSRNIRLNQYEDFLQTDAAINPGNSGGPLVNLEGKITGINSAIKSQSKGSQGVGLAISGNLAKKIVTQLLKEGTVKRGYLGVKVRDIEAELANKMGIMKNGGVYVTRVFERSPAARIGVQPGDVLHSIDGKLVRDGLELQKVIESLRIQQPVDLVITRDGNRLQLKLTIEEQPDEFGDNPINRR